MIRLTTLASPLLLIGALALPARALAEQHAPPSVADSLELLEEAKDVQARYERYREQRTPPDLASLSRRCDEIVGRYCFRFPDHIDVDDWRAPEQPVEMELARTRVLKDLGNVAGKIPGDLWILGQRVYYLTDMGAWTNAANLARRCGGRTHWWCTALAAYVHHTRGLWSMADEAFAQALEQMPPVTAALWRAPEYLLEDSAWKIYEEAADQVSLEERLWMLSDPLYLVEGNDRKTEQYAPGPHPDSGGGRQRHGPGLGRRPGGDHPPLGGARGLVPGARCADGGHADGLPSYGEPPPRSGVPAPA